MEVVMSTSTASSVRLRRQTPALESFRPVPARGSSAAFQKRLRTIGVDLRAAARDARYAASADARATLTSCAGQLDLLHRREMARGGTVDRNAGP
jgi:hypothetical protein